MDPGYQEKVDKSAHGLVTCFVYADLYQFFPNSRIMLPLN